MKQSQSLEVEARLTPDQQEVPVQPREFRLLASFLPEILKQFNRIQEDQEEE